MNNLKKFAYAAVLSAFSLLNMSHDSFAGTESRSIGPERGGVELVRDRSRRRYPIYRHRYRSDGRHWRNRGYYYDPYWYPYSYRYYSYDPYWYGYYSPWYRQYPDSGYYYYY